MTIPLEPLTAERREALQKQIQGVRDQIANVGTGQNAFLQRILLQSRVTTIQSQIDLYESDGTPKPLALGVREGRFPTDSRLYVRGELSQPGDTVRRGFPQVLTTEQPAIRRGSGRRELAAWIASADNPLTARVMANRVWLHLIGRGLVPTPDNFGANGQPASHPALLDHLALSFAENGWSVKKLIRTVVLSRAYQLSSQFDAKNKDLPRVMDIANESAATRALYGIGEQATEGFGRQCLLARRFVEAGVRFVEITSGGWDRHNNLKTALGNKALSVDKPIAGLLADLKARGLLKDTLVLWGGEFGRTPYAQGTDGRDHNSRGFTTWMAGGGARGGFSYGNTDDYGAEAVEGKVHIHDWHATILHLLGLDHEKLTYRHAGRDMRLTDVKGNVVKEIIA